MAKEKKQEQKMTKEELDIINSRRGPGSPALSITP